MVSRIAGDQMPYAKGPFSYEYIADRKSNKWRIHDSQDNAVGSADSEEEAKVLVKRLNR